MQILYLIDLWSGSKMDYSQWIEKLILYFSSAKYAQELAEAKKYFFGDVGLNVADTDSYEKRMDLFFDWYIFSRPLAGINITPIKLALEIEEFPIENDSERAIYKNLALTSHSLFEVVKIKGNDVFLKDLFRGTKHQIKDSLINFVGQNGSLIDIHIIPEGKFHQVTKGICVHPPESQKFILQELKKLKKVSPQEWENFMLKLLRMYFKLDQYQHLQCSQVYSNESPVRF